ncbi:MAG TPA: hypothetical protein DIW64_06425 [Cellvibrio sp.]|nr:hypothetical protein [Cellvibrio sp.]
MNVTTFRLNNPRSVPDGDPIFGQQKAIYHIPTLPAYALIDSYLTLDANQNIDLRSVPIIYSLDGDVVEVPNKHWNIFGPPTGLLTIYHNGIKDFELLFPHVSDNSLRARIGSFAEEAYNCFQSHSWVSYCLMVGGVLEGLLYDKFGNFNFSTLIEKARTAKIISEVEATLIDEVRSARNRIHANKHRESIIDRKMALELSVAYDRLIQRNWFD